MRLLVLAAHPDDETIGASAALGRAGNSRVCYLTDGASRDPRFRPGMRGAREDYAALRLQEAAAALRLAGVQAITTLAAVDQDAVEDCPALLEGVLAAAREFAPNVIITHPYEGGHPDHDTAALIARAAVEKLAASTGAAPELLEMTSYHIRDGRRAAGEFLALPPQDAGGGKGCTVALTQEERERKRCMLACYVSQRDVLRDFPLEPERLRAAPRYDFSRPPHQGQLWYEHLGWPMTWAKWRERAGRFLQGSGTCA